jgi:serine/threonine-protein kinase
LKQKRPRFRLRLLTRMALALAAVGLLPVALSSFGLVDANRDAIFGQVLRTHAVAARTEATRIGAFLATRAALARGAAASPELAEPRSPEAQEFLVRNLQAWSDLGVEAVAVVNARGEEVVRAQVKGEDARRRVAAALWLPPTPIPGVAVVPGEVPVVRLEASLPDGIGSLRLVCDGSPLAEGAQPEELGDEAELLMVDAAGAVVLGAPDALRRLPADLVRNALSGKLAGAGRYPTENGGEVLAAYAPVPGSSWTVLSRQPAEVAEAVRARLLGRSALAIGAALLLIAALSAAAWGSVVRPVRELVAAQRSLSRSDAASSGDEIRDLRASFEALRRGLSDRKALDDVFLGRYQVVEVLGTGGMGTVFRGWDPKLQRPVALKTVRLGADLPAEKRQDLFKTLLREAVTAARFSHPNVVAVYDLEDAPEAAFLAMEFVDGMTLERLLLQTGRLAAERVIPLGAAIARGLAAAHGRGIVHRDIKPANVLLGRDGSIKVADFGIADLLAAARPAGDVIFGTPGYLPPEVLQGEAYTVAGDLFSLGVVLYESLTGVPPFTGLEVEDIVEATLHAPIRPPAARVATIPAALDALVLRLLERDPALRPADAAAVAAELDALAQERGLSWSLEAEPPSVDLEDPMPTITRTAQWVPTTQMRG